MRLCVVWSMPCCACLCVWVLCVFPVVGLCMWCFNEGVVLLRMHMLMIMIVIMLMCDVHVPVLCPISCSGSCCVPVHYVMCVLCDWFVLVMLVLLGLLFVLWCWFEFCCVWCFVLVRCCVLL